LTFSDLPTLNAALNASSALFLALGFFAIRGRRQEAHRRFMLSAVTTSSLFLVSYLVYHFQVGSVRFSGTGIIRTVYLTILATHTVLAVVIVPLVLITLRLAVRERFAAHRRLARMALPLWAYVSVTGVVIYWMLYRL
jgi:uncharacterized membrane protein YozB (DUF420 family)